MMIATECPPPEELQALSMGRLADERSDEVLEHLRGCEPCRSAIVSVADGDDSLIAALRSPEPPTAFDAEPGYRLALAKALGALAAAGDTDSEAVRPTLPKAIGEYELVRPLGSGGMGSVFLARHTKLGREVAVKVLAGHRLGDPRMRERFDAEMRAVGKLHHPNIVTAHDAREVDGTAVLVTEYIDGLDLSELVARTGPLGIADACEIARQVAVALDYTHSQGFVHRDVKPSNIMLSRRGEVKLLDLGLARLQIDELESVGMTGTGQTMGTADYVAPEQVVDSRSVDVRADVYSLGCTLFKLLCGAAPFADAEHLTAFAKMTAHVSEPPPRLADRLSDAPPALVSLLAAMLAKDRRKRPQSPQAVADRLAPFTQGSDLQQLAERSAALEPTSSLPQAVPPTTPPTAPAPLPLLRRPIALWIALASGLAGILLGAVLGILVTIEYPDGTTVRLEAPTGSKVTLRSATGAMAQNSTEISGKPQTSSNASSIPPLQFAVLVEATLKDSAVRAAMEKFRTSDKNRPVVTEIGTWYPLSEANFPLVSDDESAMDMMGIAVDQGGLSEPLSLTYNGKRYVLARNDPEGMIGWEEIDGHLAATVSKPNGANRIELNFDKALLGKLYKLTEGNVQRQFAIILSGEVIAAPVIHAGLRSSQAVLDGDFTDQQVKALHDALNGLGGGFDPSTREPERSQRNSARENLREIGLAFHLFHDAHRKFPGSVNVLEGARRRDGETKVEPFSWRVAILPFIGELDLYEQYRFDEPWDSEHNQTFLAKMPAVYRSPLPEDPGKPIPAGETHYQGFVGEQTALGTGGGLAMREFRDGTSNTLLIVESQASVPWTKPEDLRFEKPEDAKAVQPFEGSPLYFLTADGAAHQMGPVDWEKLAKLITRNGGEVVRP